MRKKLLMLFLAVTLCFVSIELHACYQSYQDWEKFLYSVHGELKRIYMEGRFLESYAEENNASGMGEPIDSRGYAHNVALSLAKLDWAFRDYQMHAEKSKLLDLSWLSYPIAHFPSFEDIRRDLSNGERNGSKTVAKLLFLKKESFELIIRLIGTEGLTEEQIEGLTEDNYVDVFNWYEPNLKLKAGDVSAIFEKFFEKFNSDGSVRLGYLADYL